MATIKAKQSQDINDTESTEHVYYSIYWESKDKEKSKK